MENVFMNRFAQLHDESGMTYTEWAEHLKVSRNQVYRWKKGTGEPSTDMLAKIAKICGVSSDWLIGLSDVRPPSSTVAAHRTGDDIDLPPEALTAIEAFKKEMVKLYGKP